MKGKRYEIVGYNKEKIVNTYGIELEVEKETEILHVYNSKQAEQKAKELYELKKFSHIYVLYSGREVTCNYHPTGAYSLDSYNWVDYFSECS